jgi:hypothetical protein
MNDPPAATESHIEAIQDAVDAAADTGGYSVEYRVFEIGLGDLCSHEVDFSEVSSERQQAATVNVIRELADVGFEVNAVGFNSDRLHIVRREWFDERRERGANAWVVTDD